MEKVFISYHHMNDQHYKDALSWMGERYGLFVDGSVDTGDISDDCNDETIRCKIRDDYLRDSTVTVLLVGEQTKRRKHVDWELYSSMHDGRLNKRSGIVVVTLPCTRCTFFSAAHDGEKESLYPEVTSWTHIDERAEYERRYPFLPDRMIDQLLAPNAHVSVTNWDRIDGHPDRLRLLVEGAARDRFTCEYDLSRPMRRVNS